METFSHDLHSLFNQLGMNSSKESIEGFIRDHNLKQDETLAQADFWQPAQCRFLKESIAEDADWCEVIDQLDALLRK
ncbi:DUF2789 domain-containing protein [Photobacterium sp. 2_MG-2023]|uniref:DUF2789 domain-containing protein n=1 Tax=Photobacterium sp. 2_MG-2023 TaxID=3062663 RepID=UPI0026E29376|nr:DUF2789 domain-containing protein [Photobacterium sp. 2_MG-2023]MDO6582769.1 DUF2789 domain-containing protein [Photobacterium sp. 2_MG-2023]